MYQPRHLNKFKKDLKKCIKRGLPLDEILSVMDQLIEGEPLDNKHKPHKLTGNWIPCSECHIRPDWLLIYFVNDEEKVIEFIRTGSHSDLFN